MRSGKWINKTQGIGYVIIPSDSDRDKYISDCKRKSRVTLLLEDGAGVAHECYVSKHILQEIEFPNSYNQTGSCVLWNNIYGKNTPIVIAILPKENEHTPSMGDEYLVTKGDSNNYFKTIGNKKGKYTITVKSETSSGIFLNAIQKTKNAIISFISSGKIKMQGGDTIELQSFNNLVLRYTNVDQIKESVFSIDVDGKIRVIPYDLLYFFEGSEFILLGETTKQLLSDILDGINALTVTTPVGVSGTPVNIATFTEIKNRLDSILSQKVKTD
jgi:hypothetical protein